MKLAIVGDYPIDPARINGGVQAVSHTLVEELSRRDSIELHAVTFSDCQAPYIKEMPPGFTLHVLPYQPGGLLTRYRASVKSVHNTLASIRPTVVHGQGLGVSGLATVQSDYPSVLTAHGIVREDARNLSRVRDKLKGYVQSRVCEDYCLKNATDIISISPHFSDYFGERVQGRLSLISNPIKQDYFDVRRRAEAGRILFAGKISKRKGIGELLDAVKILNTAKIQLRLAGSSEDDSLVERIRKLDSDPEFSAQLSLLGLLNEAQLLEEFAVADVLVLPSHQEVAPMVIQQAMAAGLPIVATDVGGVKYQLDDGNLGYMCKVGDAQGLAELISRALNPEFGSDPQRDSAKIKAIAHERFHVSSVAEATIKKYSEVI